MTYLELAQVLILTRVDYVDFSVAEIPSDSYQGNGPQQYNLNYECEGNQTGCRHSRLQNCVLNEIVVV